MSEITSGPWSWDGDELFGEGGRKLVLSAGLGRSGGCSVKADEENRRAIATTPDLHNALKAATHALRSYQYGNSSTELAASVVSHCEAVLAKVEGGK